MSKRIGLLTAGGDAPGENYCIKTIVEDATQRGYEVIGIRKGWEGFIKYDLEDPVTHSDNAQILTPARMHNIERLNASFLHASRVLPDRITPADIPPFLSGDISDLTGHVKKVINHLQLENLIVLGDAPSLKYASRLSNEDMPIVGVPVSVQNDVEPSMYSLGASTAIGRAVELVHEMKDLAASREAIMALGVQGYGNGLTTLLVAMFAGIDRVLIPEVPFDPHRLVELLQEDKRINPNNYALLLINEGARIDPVRAPDYSTELTADVEQVGMRAAAAKITQILRKIAGERILLQPLSYLTYTGQPDGWDMMAATSFGTIAVDLVDSAKTGQMAAFRIDRGYMSIPLESMTQPGPRPEVSQFYNSHTYTSQKSVIFRMAADMAAKNE